MVSFQEHQNRRLGRIDPEMGRGLQKNDYFFCGAINLNLGKLQIHAEPINLKHSVEASLKLGYETSDEKGWRE